MHKGSILVLYRVDEAVFSKVANIAAFSREASRDTKRLSILLIEAYLRYGVANVIKGGEDVTG